MGRIFIVEEVVEKSSSMGKGGCLLIILFFFALFYIPTCVENEREKFKEDPEVRATLNTFISGIKATTEDERRLRKCLNKILSCGNIDAESSDGRRDSALYYACATGNYELVKWLVEHGAYVKGKDIREAAAKVSGTEGEKIRVYLKSNGVEFE